jgi:hypothetical protein
MRSLNYSHPTDLRLKGLHYQTADTEAEATTEAMSHALLSVSSGFAAASLERIAADPALGLTEKQYLYLCQRTVELDPSVVEDLTRANSDGRTELRQELPPRPGAYRVADHRPRESVVSPSGVMVTLAPYTGSSPQVLRRSRMSSSVSHRRLGAALMDRWRLAGAVGAGSGPRAVGVRHPHGSPATGASLGAVLDTGSLQLQHRAHRPGVRHVQQRLPAGGHVLAVAVRRLPHLGCRPGVVVVGTVAEAHERGPVIGE